MKYLFFIILGITFNSLFAQNLAEKALTLTGKDRYHPDVLAFYQENEMDTSSRFIHYLKADRSLALAMDPLSNYSRIFQVSIDKELKSNAPLGLQWKISQADAELKTSKSLIVSPNKIENQTESLIVKGGIAIILVFNKNQLDNLYSIGAVKPVSDVNEWVKSAYSKYSEGCIAGDCSENFSIFAKDLNVMCGILKNGVSDGFSMIFYADSEFFNGIYNNGVRKNGVYFFKNGNYFSGNYDSYGKPANGNMNYENGNVFRGDFINGKPIKGKVTYKSGDYFEGRFRENGKYLEGTLFLSGSGTFKGSFDENEKPFNGILTTVNGTKYKVNEGKKSVY